MKRIKLLSLTALVLLVPISSAANKEKQQWPNYPHCKTYECVEHTKQIKADRLARCKKNAIPVKASVFGHSKADDNGKGYRGDNTTNKVAWAELNNGVTPGINGASAFGNKPYRYRLTFFRKGYRATAPKLDIGKGAADGRKIDMNKKLALKLRVSTSSFLGTVWVTHNRCS